MTTTLPIVWMFSGQGAQYYQMGASLYAGDAAFRAAFDDCARRFEPQLGRSLADLLYQPRADRFVAFERTTYSHAALFAAQYAAAAMLSERGHRPDFLLGYSLGEFVALAVSGCLSLDDAVRAVYEHAAALEARAPRGGMLAVVEPLDVLRRFPAEFAAVDIAAENYASHFVVAGTVPAIQTLHRALRAAGVNTALLPVDFAFHSAQIAPASAQFESFARTLRFAPPRIPVISAERARVLRAPQPADLWRVTAHRVKCQATVEVMEDYGAYHYVDLGPSGTLANFVKYNLSPRSHSQTHTIMTPFGQDIAVLNAMEARIPRSLA